MDAVHYRTAKKILSQDDLVQWFWLDRFFLYRTTVPTVVIPFSYYSPIFSNVGEEEKSEYVLTVQKRAANEEKLIGGFLEKLNAKIEIGKKPYSFLATKNGMAVIIDDGFLTHMATKENEENFIRLYLENSEVFFPQETVASFPIYKQYLKGFSLI